MPNCTFCGELFSFPKRKNFGNKEKERVW